MTLVRLDVTLDLGDEGSPSMAEVVKEVLFAINVTGAKVLRFGFGIDPLDPEAE